MDLFSVDYLLYASIIQHCDLYWDWYNARTKAGIEKAKADGVKFGRTIGTKNKTTQDKIEKIKIFLVAKKSYDWIANELSVSKQPISEVKKIFVL